jgi:hypothetical protein
VDNAAAYVPASLSGLAAALASANAVQADDDATTAQVTAAQTALIASIAAVRLKASGAGAAPLAAAGTLLPAAAAAKAAPAPGPGAKAVQAKFAKAPKPTIAGAKAVGKKLKAKAGAWSQAPELSYQWYRGGKRIAKATGPVYKLKPADRGQRIRVKVTARQAGFATAVKASAKTKRIK